MRDIVGPSSLSSPIPVQYKQLLWSRFALEVSGYQNSNVSKKVQIILKEKQMNFTAAGEVSVNAVVFPQILALFVTSTKMEANDLTPSYHN